MFKIFGSKKEEFFLEIDDSKEAPKAESPKAPAEPPKAETPVEKPVETPVAASAEAPKAAAPAAPPAPAIPAKPKAPEPVVLFAPDNLMPLPNPTRRRPGPNMAAFLDMAKQVKRR